MSGPFLLSEAHFFKVSGLHAERYLHNRLSNNIKDLQVNQSCKAAALTPQARVEALFTVIRLAKESFLVYCDGGDQTAVLAALKRYLVAERVNVELANYKLVHSVVEIFGAINSIQKLRIADKGFDLIFDDSAKELAELQFASKSEYNFLRISAGNVQFPNEVGEQYILSETGPVDAFQFGQGCYVGQEVIEKINAIGKAPRRIIRGKIAGIYQDLKGAELFAVKSNSADRGKETNQAAGKVLSSASFDGQTVFFALVRSTSVFPENVVSVSEVLAEIF